MRASIQIRFENASQSQVEDDYGPLPFGTSSEASIDPKLRNYHAKIWPEILATIQRCHIRNYSILLKDDLLFGYYEDHGTDYEADMARVAADRKTHEW